MYTTLKQLRKIVNINNSFLSELILVSKILVCHTEVSNMY